jgi:GNAT superfamily N-acetyltransferase
MATSNTAVHMLRPTLSGIPQHPFPAGYSIRAMKRGDEVLWTDVQRDAEPFFKIEDGLFAAEFGSDWDVIKKRCFLICNERGATAGTISAWFSDNFKGGDWGRIHWVAVRPSAQGKGLAKAGLSHAMNVLAKHHQRAWLATSSGRLGAIKLYLDFGFVPDMEPADAGAAAVWDGVFAALKNPR